MFARDENMLAREENMIARHENMFARHENMFARHENMFARHENMFAHSPVMKLADAIYAIWLKLSLLSLFLNVVPTVFGLSEDQHLNTGAYTLN
jgi:hypothetical protein